MFARRVFNQTIGQLLDLYFRHTQSISNEHVERVLQVYALQYYLLIVIKPCSQWSARFWEKENEAKACKHAKVKF